MTRICPAVLAVLAGACGGGGGGPRTPTNPAAGTSIGTNGGTVTSADGVVRLVIPAGSLASAQSISILAATVVPLDPMAIPGSAYQIQPFVSFAVNATLTIRYDPGRLPSGIEESEMRLFGINGDSWNGVGNSTNDGVAHAAVGSIRQTATFGVRWAGRPCRHREDGQFDFLLGSWNTSGTALPTGTSDVVCDLGDACAVNELLQQGTQRIRAVSLFSSVDGRWHQNWVDSNGRRGVKMGGLEGTRMVVYESSTSRQAWEPQADDSILFASERGTEAGAWTLQGEGRYTRR
jgi:hypothetical protein